MITTLSQFHANSKDGQTKQYETTDNKITYKVLMRLEYERTVFKASKESILSIIVLKRKHKDSFLLTRSIFLWMPPPQNFDAAKSRTIVGFTLEAQLVSSKHLILVHLED